MSATPSQAESRAVCASFDFSFCHKRCKTAGACWDWGGRASPPCGIAVLTATAEVAILLLMTPKGMDHWARPNKHAARYEKEATETVVKPLDEGALTDIVERTPQGLYLILDCIQDPHNLGAILRTADGAGVSAVIAPKDKSASITETVMRVSVGAAARVPFVQVTNLVRTMKYLKESGIWITGTSDRGDRSLYETDLRGGTALVLGAEGDGMRRLTTENCDFLVRIPMRGSVPCLNVSVAAGVCLYEALRQRETIEKQ